MDELRELLDAIDDLAKGCQIADLPGNPLAEQYNVGVTTFAVWVKQRINRMLLEGGEKIGS